MQNASQIERKETWPVKAYMEDIIGQQSELFIRGALLDFSDTLENYVVFLSPRQITDNRLCSSIIKESDMQNVELFESEGKSSFRLRRGRNLCDAIRWFTHREADGCDCLGKDKLCLAYDKSAAYAFFASDAWMDEKAFFDYGDFHFEKLETDDKGLAYRYICKVTGLTEWIIPIYINIRYPATEDQLKGIDKKYSKLLGVLITGQFMGATFNGQIAPEIQSLISSDDYDNREQLLACMFPEPNIDDKNVKVFFKSVKSFSGKVRQMYVTCIKSKETELQQDFAIKNDAVGTRLHKTPEFYWNQFGSLRHRLIETLINLQDNVAFEEIDVFIPPSKINVNEKIEKLHAFRIEHNTRITDINVVDTDENNDELHKQAEMIMESSIWRSQLTKENKELLLFGDCPLDAEMFCEGHRWHKGVNGVDKGYAIYAYATGDRKSSPLVFMIRDVDSQRLCNMHVTEKVFETIARQFWTQWSGIYAEYLAFINETIVRYNNHEISQIAVGIDAQNELVKPYLSELRADVSTMQKIRDFIKDMGGFSKQLSLVTHLAFTSFQRTPMLRSFLPYKEVILPARDIFELEALKLGYKALVCPEHLYGDGLSKYPAMYSDSAKVYQITANLLKNAVKYSHYCSNIHLNFYVTNNDCDESVYRLIVTNYGPPDYWVNEGDMFDMGTRSDYAKLNDTTGIGFGLYLVKRFIKMLEGDVYVDKPKQISEYNVPLLSTYENFNNQLTVEQQALYQSTLNAFMEKDNGDLYTKIVAPIQRKHDVITSVIRSQSFDTYSYFKQHINDGTAEFCFKVDFPHRH